MTVGAFDPPFNDPFLLLSSFQTETLPRSCVRGGKRTRPRAKKKAIKDIFFLFLCLCCIPSPVSFSGLEETWSSCYKLQLCFELWRSKAKQKGNCCGSENMCSRCVCGRDKWNQISGTLHKICEHMSSSTAVLKLLLFCGDMWQERVQSFIKPSMPSVFLVIVPHRACRCLWSGQAVRNTQAAATQLQDIPSIKFD